MKIYNSITIDIKTGETLRESSYEYNGPLALSKGGGGGGGGSGEVDYPVYMKEVQADWLAGGEPTGSGLATLTAGNDITNLLDTAIGSSPYAAVSAYDPTDELNSMSDAIDAFCNSSVVLPELDSTTRFKEAINAVDTYDNSIPFSDAETALDNYSNYIDSIETTSKIESELSQFNNGAQSINAVNSSSFGIGHQIIAGNLVDTKIKAKSDLVSAHMSLAQLKTAKADLVIKSSINLANMAIQNAQTYAQLHLDKNIKNVHYTIEYLRMSIAAGVEKTNKDIQIDKKDAEWDLKIFQHGSNLLAGIGGGTVTQDGNEEVSDGQAAMSGALSGAAAGAAYGAKAGTSVSPGWGTAIGAVVGGVGGMLMN